MTLMLLADSLSAQEIGEDAFAPVRVAAVRPFEMIEEAAPETIGMRLANDEPGIENVATPDPNPAPSGGDEGSGSTPLDGQSPSAENAGSDFPRARPNRSSSDRETAPAAKSDDAILTFDIVAESVYQHFPAIREATQRQQEAIGNTISARGNFDDKLEAYSINQPLGFYENYRHGIDFKRPVYRNGGEISAGYRMGDGNFEPWYGERETDEGGEFKVGAVVPLAQNRAIDPRRTELRVALIALQQTQPQVFESILLSQREAIQAYWGWVNAGLQLRIQRELLTLAEDRVAQIDRQIKAGDVARIVGIDNQRLLASREIKRVEADAKAGQAAFKLSIYFRDDFGQPLLPPLSAVPHDLPAIDEEPLEASEVISLAIRQRPELEVLRLEQQKLNAELRLAANQMLPTVDLGVELSQDVGGLTSSKGDKQPFKAEAAIIGSVPVQRRKAIGKQRALLAKIAQVDAKYQLITEKIAAEIGQIVLARNTAALQVKQSKRLVSLARQTLSAGRTAFDNGDIDILLLNIYEQSLADAESILIAAEVDYFVAEGLRRVTAGELPGRDFDFPTDMAEHMDDFIPMNNPE